ncbi:unnamed protein product [Diamesa hyperborea]
MDYLNCSIDQCFTSDFYQFNPDIQSNFHFTNDNSYCESSINSVSNFDNDWYYNNDEELSYHELTSTNYANNLTSELSELDQILMFESNESMILDNYDNLPDKTFMCNDACNIFLKESSDNLKLSSFKTSDEEQKDEDSDVKQVFKCEFGDCQKIYSKPAHLKAHLRRHLGLKPYTCNWPNCCWKFSRSDELARHRRSHSGIKPYKCDYCTKTFSRSDHLNKHRKVHEKKLNGKIKLMWQDLPKLKPGRKKKNPVEIITT